MGDTKPLGLIVGFLSCVAVGVAIHFIIQTGSCGGMRPACPDDVIPYTFLLPAGIVGAVLSMFIGGGWVVFSGLFVAIGLGAMSVLLPFDDKMMASGDIWFPLLFGGMFALSGFVPLGMRVFAGRRARAAAQLVATGKPAIGTVTEVSDTNWTVNNNPRVHLRMRAEPTDGSAPVELEKSITVSRLSIPRVGERYPVWFDPANPSRWAFGTDVQPSAAASVRALFARAAARQAGAAPPSPTEDASSDALGEIERLAALRDAGAVTEEDYQAAKARLLRRVGSD